MTLKPDLVLAFVLLDVAIILVAARAVGALARVVGQPAVVGEIAAGVLLGPTLFGRTVFAWDSPWGFLHCDDALAASGALPSVSACFFPPQARSVLGILGQLALVLFMFLVGLELDWDLLKGKGRGIASVSVGAVAVPIALGLLVGPLLYNATFAAGFGSPAQPSKASFTIMVAAMLSVTAFPVMARILQEKGLTQSTMGSVGVAAAAVVTVLMFLTVAVASSVATRQGAGKLVLKFGGAAIFIAVLFVVVRPALETFLRSYEEKGLSANLFAAILILLFGAAYAADRIGINVIVGSFLFGSILPARDDLFRDMSARLADLTAIVLLPIFLAFSGLNTDFTKFGSKAVAGTLLFLAAGIVGKWAGAALFARGAGLSWAEGNVLGVLMNCRGLLVLVVALIGLSSGVISPQMQVGGVLMALVTTMMTGPLFDAFLPRVTAAQNEI